MTTTEAPVELIADGVYENVPEPIYRSSPEWSHRMNPSTLEWGQETMEHLKSAWDGELKPKTKALAFGTAGHCRLLEPDRFKRDFGIKGQCAAMTLKKVQCKKSGQVRVDGKWLCDDHSPTSASEVEGISEEEFCAIERARQRVLRHPAAALLHQVGGCEVSIAWTDPRTKIKCKTRLDKWMPECKLPGESTPTPTIADLKYLCAVDSHSLEAAIEEHGYARRAAMTQDGVEALTGLRPDYLLVCILKTPPYSVVVKILDAESLTGGRWEYRNSLALWSQCLRTGVYPGYSRDIEEIGVPGWKKALYRKVVPND